MAPPTSPSPTALICSDTQMHNFVSLRPPGYTHTRSRRKIQLSIIQSLTSCRLLSWATSIVFSARLNPLPPPKTSWFQGWGSSKCKLLLLLWFQKTIWEKWPVSHGHQFQNPHSVMREARWRIASGALLYTARKERHQQKWISDACTSLTFIRQSVGPWPECLCVW